MVVVSTSHGVYDGTALDLRDTTVAAADLLAAIRGESPTSLDVTCSSPTPPHDVLGHVSLDDAIPSRRALLAAAARSRGHTAPQRPAYDASLRKLRELEVPTVDVATARKRVADAGAEEAQLRERMATLRGRLQARRETDAETASVTTDLTDTAARLSEVETERIAAEQALDRQERRAADAREVRQRRLELEDRVANLERRMRASLAERISSVFDEERDSLGSLDALGSVEFDGADADVSVTSDDLLSQLVAVRVADLAAPVVVSASVFTDARSAARSLDASVILL
ncbi:hypothetical protein SAMN04487950_3157 [Halogranum rubrum]|uniref:Uncharacterized protein n=1 Tax=Halogranum rubrum TaxID=553466 RepID=A0A1I4GC73_9EURY|nr:hypothetical protein SAMN04487950_3157 [Halogranum rubrum]